VGCSRLLGVYSFRLRRVVSCLVVSCRVLCLVVVVFGVCTSVLFLASQSSDPLSTRRYTIDYCRDVFFRGPVHLLRHVARARKGVGLPKESSGIPTATAKSVFL